MSPENKKHVRVLLIEDCEEDADRIAQALKGAEFQLALERVTTADELHAGLKEFSPDVVLSEHLLPNLDYRAALQIVRAILPRIPFIVVTGPLRSDDSGCCVRAGAETVISKQNLPRLGPAILRALEVRSPLHTLTTRQLEVMQLVASGCRTREIAQQLQLSEKTVESHRTQVMRRLGIESTAHLIRYAIRVGIGVVTESMSRLRIAANHNVRAAPEDA